MATTVMSSGKYLELEKLKARLERIAKATGNSSKLDAHSDLGLTVPHSPKGDDRPLKNASGEWRSRSCTGLRVDRRVLPLFKKLCHGEGFTLGRAVEEFMKASLEAGGVGVALAGARKFTEAQGKTDTALVRLKMVDIESLMEAGRVDMDKGSVFRLVRNENELMESANSILSVLPRVNDSQLSGEAASLLEKVMVYIREERLYNIKKTSALYG